MTLLTVPTLPAQQPSWGQFQVYWQQIIGDIVSAVNAVAVAQAAAAAAQAAADAAEAAAAADMPEIAPVTIYADHTGTVQAGQLPLDVQASRFNNLVNVTTSSTWSFAVASGGITASIGAATGILNITALASTASVTITSVYLGIERSRLLVVTKSTAPPPSSGTGGGGGTTASDSTFSSFNSTGMAAVSNELTVVAGTAGQVQLSAPLTVGTGTSINGEYQVYGIWQWDSTGAGVWVDLGTESDSSPNCEVNAGIVTRGAISVSYTKTALTPSSSYKFRLRARKFSGTAVMYLYGTASAVGT